MKTCALVQAVQERLLMSAIGKAATSTMGLFVGAAGNKVDNDSSGIFRGATLSF
jgi:hypothetical protein